MKAFWASVILFALLVTAVSVNAVFVHRFTHKLIHTAHRLEQAEKRDALLRDLENDWNRNRTWLTLSMKQSDLNRVDELLVILRWAHDEQNEDSFLKHRALLVQVATEFNRTERLSLQNIF